MTSRKFAPAALVALTCLCGAAHPPAVARAEGQGLAAAAGRWTAVSGATMTIRVTGGNAMVWGQDSRSGYTMRCRLYETPTGIDASCAGDGYNFESGLPFEYGSDFTIEGDTLSETWQAFFIQENGEMKKLEGKEDFGRQGR